MSIYQIIHILISVAVIIYIIFPKKYIYFWFRKKHVSETMSDEQAVIVYLRNNSLPKEVYEKYDVSMLENSLEEVLLKDKLGFCDGNEFGESETIIYFYGSDSEKMFEIMEPILKTYPLCKNAKIIIRWGKFSSDQREIII